jgi:hypothetical protein
MSGRVMGAHQKLDRVARHHLSKLIEDNRVFPPSRAILHFEGKNGPDAIKRKSPAQDEPWHFYSPFDEEDSQLIELINNHYSELVKQLKSGNKERSAFEAAWLAHALTDGLTPAHHYPYESKLSELRGEGSETRNTIKEKLVMPGETPREKMKNNWKMWGPRGLMTAHGLFELGVASLIAPMSFSKAVPRPADIRAAQAAGIDEVFKSTAREIATMDMFDRYHKRGWTTKLAAEVRTVLAPAIIQTITLAWYMALIDAGLVVEQ